MTNVEVLKECRMYDDVKNYVEENRHYMCYVDDYINRMSRHSILRAYLEWNGIYNYSCRIVTLVSAMLNEEFDVDEVDFYDYNSNGDLSTEY
jgi:hypothetical protein